MMMIKILDTSENISTSKKNQVISKPWGKNAKNIHFCMKLFAQMKLIGFYLNHLVEEKH